MRVRPADDEQQAGSSAHGAVGGAGGQCDVLVVYRAPCILPWLWDEAAPAADLHPSAVPLIAGSRGAPPPAPPARRPSPSASTPLHVTFAINVGRQPPHTHDVLSSPCNSVLAQSPALQRQHNFLLHHHTWTSKSTSAP